ncbi:MAG: hypothetical protein WCT05_09980 [Lentisphaeria bacterium]
MKKVLFSLLPLCLLATACRNVDCCLRSATLSGTESRILQNQFIRAEIVPAATGGIVGLTYLPLQKEILPPFQYMVEKIDLIPDRTVIKGGGSRILLWGEKNLSSQEMSIRAEKATADCCSVELFNPYYQSSNLSLQKKVSLNKNRAALQIDLEAQNKTSRPITVTLWDNMIAQLQNDSMDTILMPARGKTTKIGKRGVQFLPEDGIFNDNDDVFDKVIFIAPARNWIARKNPKSSLIFAIRGDFTDLSPEGFFYTWKKQSGSPLHTMELIFNPYVLEAQKNKCYRLEYLFFQGLPSLDEICGDIGIYAEFQKKQVLFLFNSVDFVPEKNLQVRLRNTENQEFYLGEKQLRALSPTKVQKLLFTLPPLPPGTYQLQGCFEQNESFELLKTLTIEPGSPTNASH